MDNLTTNPMYQSGLARLKYYPDPIPIPDVFDTEGMVRYYKRIYNTAGGAAELQPCRDVYHSLLDNNMFKDVPATMKG